MIYARSMKADRLLTSNTPDIFTDSGISQPHLKKRDELLKLILQIPTSANITLLPRTILRKNPYPICNTIGLQIHSTKIENHVVLHADAQGILYLPETGFSDYMNKYQAFRQRIIVSR
eukprot:gb/GEZJ01005623.1/.p1 GENE.gb/GEZJ01005623.1/~~gb/GEZJ01005623.1/.p1  ORF type:complete len:118 (+),score=7.83 gb/GEZJ01005623.1/:878-1231(+)